MRNKTITKNYYRLYSPKLKKQIGETSESLSSIKQVQSLLTKLGQHTIIQVSSVVYTPFRRLK